MTNQGQIQQESHAEKNIGFRLVFFYLDHHIHQTSHQVIFIFFPFFQNTLKDRKYNQDQVKTFLENLLSSKQAEFYLRGINKLLDK